MNDATMILLIWALAATGAFIIIELVGIAFWLWEPDEITRTMRREVRCVVAIVAMFPVSVPIVFVVLIVRRLWLNRKARCNPPSAS